MKKRLSVIVIGLSLLIMSTVAFASEKIGLVISSAGPTYAIDKNQQQRPLSRGSDILLGDTVVTGATGVIQFRLNDDTAFALKPNSKLALLNFKYKYKDKDNKSTAKLIEGGFRTVTGAISNENPDNYSVETPVAVIGVRGTDYTAVLVLAPSAQFGQPNQYELQVTVWHGAVIIKNNAGSIVIGDGYPQHSSSTSNINSPPKPLNYIPSPCLHCGT